KCWMYKPIRPGMVLPGRGLKTGGDWHGVCSETAMIRPPRLCALNDEVSRCATGVVPSEDGGDGNGEVDHDGGDPRHPAPDCSDPPRAAGRGPGSGQGRAIVDGLAEPGSELPVAGAGRGGGGRLPDCAKALGDAHGRGRDPTGAGVGGIDAGPAGAAA